MSQLSYVPCVPFGKQCFHTAYRGKDTRPVSVLPGIGGWSPCHEPPSVSRGSALPPSRLFPLRWSGRAGATLSEPCPVEGAHCLGSLHPHLTPLPDTRPPHCASRLMVGEGPQLPSCTPLPLPFPNPNMSYNKIGEIRVVLMSQMLFSSVLGLTPLLGLA